MFGGGGSPAPAQPVAPPPPPNPPMFGSDAQGAKKKPSANRGFSSTILGGTDLPANTSQKSLLGG